MVSSPDLHVLHPFGSVRRCAGCGRFSVVFGAFRACMAESDLRRLHETLRSMQDAREALPTRRPWRLCIRTPQGVVTLELQDADVDAFAALVDEACFLVDLDDLLAQAGLVRPILC